jgi:hypothetical protein
MRKGGLWWMRGRGVEEAVVLESVSFLIIQSCKV